MATEAGKNVICSPLSTHIVLSSVACGARGKTAEEFKTGLHLLSEDSMTHKGFKFLLDSLNVIDLNCSTPIYYRIEEKLFIDSLLKKNSCDKSHNVKKIIILYVIHHIIYNS